MQPAPTYLVYQRTINVPFYGSGAVDLAIDSQSSTLFITYEYNNTIAIINATTFANLGQVRVSNATNLAGIVYDHDKRLIYTVDRLTNDLYVYKWNFSECTLTFQNHIILANSSRAYGIALDEMNGALYVADGEYSRKFDWYDTSTWLHIGTKNTSHAVIGIAVDASKGLVYTGGGYDYGYDYGLYRYNKTDDTEIVALNGTNGIYAAILDVAVDPNYGLVYVTTYGERPGVYKDVLMILDFNLNVLWKSRAIGNPTGIAIPEGEITYEPANSIDIKYWLIVILTVGFVMFGILFILKHRRHSITHKTRNTSNRTSTPLALFASSFNSRF
jgi:DNA-binding beta-propeller fold protein YncE